MHSNRPLHSNCPEYFNISSYVIETLKQYSINKKLAGNNNSIWNLSTLCHKSHNVRTVCRSVGRCSFNMEYVIYGLDIPKFSRLNGKRKTDGAEILDWEVFRYAIAQTANKPNIPEPMRNDMCTVLKSFNCKLSLIIQFRSVYSL